MTEVFVVILPGPDFCVLRLDRKRQFKYSAV
jgi:hypothetical protein